MNGARTHYIIVFQGRAGSSYLVDALARLPGVVAGGEDIADMAPPSGSIVRRLRWLVRPAPAETPAAVQVEYARWFYGTPREGARAVGFKTKVKDIYDHALMGRVLNELEVRAIVLERRNLVKQAVSRLNAARLHEARGHWNRRAARSPLGPFAPDPEIFDLTLRRVAFAQEMLDAFVTYLGAPTLRLEYEDLVRDRTAWFASVCRFLGLPPAEPTSSLGKNTPDDLRAVLVNVDVLRARYEGTPYAPQFDEVTVSAAPADEGAV
jgi:LPS sulfotransferase NodH